MADGPDIRDLAPKPPRSSRCFRCGDAAAIRTIAFDAPPTATDDDRTMDLCYRHFWDWNAHSLRRRGLHIPAAQIDAAIRDGTLNYPPQRQWPTGAETTATDRRMF